MIQLTRLNGTPICLNENNILWIEALPDTSVMLIGGERVLLRESVEQVLELITSTTPQNTTSQEAHSE